MICVESVEINIAGFPSVCRRHWRDKEYEKGFLVNN
jgi:hypothetical protein